MQATYKNETTKSRFRKHIKGYGFCHLQETLVINMMKTLMDTATKTGIDAAKTASKRVVQKTAEATGDLIGNKMADKIISIGKPRERTKEIEETYIPPEKRQQIIDDLRMHQRIKMEFQKILNFFNTNFYENLPIFITKKWVEVYDQSEKNYSPN